MTHQKRISAPKHYDIERKGLTYISTSEGSRGKENGIPVLLFLREITNYADTKKEAKQIIRNGQLERNGDRVRDVRDSAGVMDALHIPKVNESYRVLPSKETMLFYETTDQRPAAKIEDKSVEGEEYVYHLHNGENYRSTEDYSTGSTLVFEDDEAEAFPLEEGEEVLVLNGQHAGKTAEVKQLNKRGMRPDTAIVETEEEFEIQQDSVFVVGDLEVPENE